MSLTQPLELPLADFHPRLDTFHEDFLAGLRASPRRLSPKYFYDEKGSQLFDRICELEEYFPTRTELSILRRFQPEIREVLGPRCRIVEFGSGSSMKTEILLDCLVHPRVYLPIEISREALQQAAAGLASGFPEVEILPVCADYTADFSLPVAQADFERTVIFFPGSTIGNFERAEAERFLAHAREICGGACGLLIGVGLQTDTDTLERAYNDAAGVTAAFNLNVLRRAQRELGARLDPAGFRHEAHYNREKGRIEMRLVSERVQAIELDGESFPFEVGDAILTEYSHKFTIEGFSALARRAGFDLKRSWTDDEERFAVLYLESV